MCVCFLCHCGVNACMHILLHEKFVFYVLYVFCLVHCKASLYVLYIFFSSFYHLFIYIV